MTINFSADTYKKFLERFYLALVIDTNEFLKEDFERLML